MEELPKVRNEEVVRRWLDGLLPEEYLQVVQDRGLTNRLRLLDPTIHALNIFQTLLVLFVGSVVLFVAAACIAYGYEAGYDGRNLPHLKATLDCVFWAVFFFSFLRNLLSPIPLTDGGTCWYEDYHFAGCHCGAP